MAILTRGERFKDARVVYNQHGKQSMDKVAKATKISASMIKDLEDDKSNRDVGYEKVATLAKHYGVSGDWLLCLSDDPSRKPSAVDELGLDPSVINGILKIKTGIFLSDREAQEGLNIFLTESLKDRAVFYRYISRLCAVVEAEKEDSSVYFEMFGIDNDSKLSMDEKYRLAELTMLNTLEDVRPGVTSRLSIVAGHKRIKPEIDNTCELFRKMLENMTGYRDFVESRNP